jgi:HK97 family phage portal protein
VRSVLLERVLKAGPSALAGERSWGMTGAHGERYEPESRKEFLDAYRDRVWTQRCVNLISTSATQVELEVKVRGEWIEEHELIDVLERPSRRDPAMMFFEELLKWAEIMGEWQWEMVPSRAGKIGELFRLRSHLVRVLPGEEGQIEGYIYDKNETGVDVVEYGAQVPGEPTLGDGDKSIVLAGRYASPTDDYYGMGPLRAAKDDIISEYYGIRYDHRFFRNGGRPDVVLGFKNKLDPEQRKENKEEWQDFKGVDNSHRAAVIDGDPNVTLLSQNQKDVEYLEGRRLSREGQCAAFGVPPVLVGDLTRATYSNYEVAEYIFWKGTMLPKLQFCATWANFVLLPYYPDVEEFAFGVKEVAALQQAEGWRSDRIRGEVTGGLLTPNEGREMLDREPMDEPNADVLWLPTKSRPIDATPGPGQGGAPAVPPPTPDPPPEPIPVPPGEASAHDVALASGLTLRNALATRHKVTVQTWLRNVLEAKRRFSDRGTNEIAKHFGEQRDNVLAIVEGQEKSAELERLLREYGWADDAVGFHEMVEAMQAGMVASAFKLTEGTVDTAPVPGLVEKLTRQLADRPDGIGSVSGRVKTEVLDEVRTGIAHGLTYRQIAEGGTFTSATQEAEEVTVKGIKGVYGEYTTWQAERIARTEAGVSFNRASAALMKEATVTEVDIIDGDGDDACAEWNGERKPIDEYEAEPLGHPNCTRIGLPVIEAAAAGD